MTKCFFVTGTDTNIGKTMASCALLQSAVQAGYRAVGYKPVASGCEMTSDGLYNCDALALMASSNVTFDIPKFSQLAFFAPISPHIASLDEGQHIDFSLLSAGLRTVETAADWLVVEGAGGWFTPLTESLTYADWVIAERLPVIMVVGVKLGCINHALLTALAVQQAGLSLAGWIANHPIPTCYRSQDYLTTLQQRLCAPLLGEIPWLDIAEKASLSNYLDLSLLGRPF